MRVEEIKVKPIVTITLEGEEIGMMLNTVRRAHPHTVGGTDDHTFIIRLEIELENIIGEER